MAYTVVAFRDPFALTLCFSMVVQKHSNVGWDDCDLLVVVYNGHSSAGRERIGPIARRCRTGTTRPRIILALFSCMSGPVRSVAHFPGAQKLCEETGNDCLQVRSPKRKSSQAPETDGIDRRPSKQGGQAGTV